MRDLGRLGQWAALIATCALTVFSIVGAFLGAERAAEMFESPPMAAFWILLTALLILLLICRRARAGSLGVLTGSVGALLVLLGGFFGSNAGHRVATDLFGSQRIPSGLMVIARGQQSNVVADAGMERVVGRLPFSLKLTDFKIEYYERAKAAAGTEMSRAVRTYESDVVVVMGAQQVAQRAIRVNHPLHYGGYDFYQQGYGRDGEWYTILLVRSDSGLALVYCGFGLLCAGVLWCCWGRPAWAFLANRSVRSGT